MKKEVRWNIFLRHSTEDGGRYELIESALDTEEGIHDYVKKRYSDLNMLEQIPEYSGATIMYGKNSEMYTFETPSSNKEGEQ